MLESVYSIVKEDSMLRIILGVVGGFIAWMMVWFGSEKLLSSIFPQAIGAPQKAFTEALTQGSAFTPTNTLLLTHIVMCVFVSALAGYLGALIAGDSSRAPLYVGILLLLMGVAKASMSWQLVPLWYHIAFTALLLPMALLGGRLFTTS